MNTTYSIDGMHCKSCVMNVEELVLEVPGVTAATASLDNANVTVEHDGSVTDDAVRAAIVEAGFTPGA